MARIGIGLSKEIDKTQKLFSLVRIKSFIFVLAFISAKLAIVGGFRKIISAILYLQLRTY